MTETIQNTTQIRTKVDTILKALSKGLYEREEPINLALLATIAGESIFLLGPPGVGKSLIARRLKYAFSDGVSFEYLMSKFSTPDEIFGPVSIKKLKEEDKYERLTERYLPGANIVFLDEIWKAGPAIQNALLTILNEKIYRNGEDDMEVDIRGIITASNELPPQNANLAPIWDRFLIRLEMGNIKAFGNFLNMITDTGDLYKDDIGVEAKLSKEELADWSEQIDKIEIGPEILNTIQMVKMKLIEHNARVGDGASIVVHDRRWKKTIRLLRAAAFMNGRTKVDLMDCFLMHHCLWSVPSQKAKILEILTEAVAKHGYTMAVNLTMLKKEVQEFTEDVEQETKIKHTVNEAQLMTFDDDYLQLEKETNKFQGAFITINQFRQLTIDELSVINFFDENKNLVNRVRTSKGKNKHTIVVSHDSKEVTYNLTTKLVDKTDVILKAPHKILQKHWDERHHELSTFIKQQLQNMSNNAPKELNGVAQNFFVNEDFAQIVRKNFDEVKNSLSNLQLQLEKLQYAYTHL